ncbi:MAG: hypothetical protein HY670_04250 [Chloroflexi bacterium]|nr:hypothetical protein [Chloroflexota bacterium]
MLPEERELRQFTIEFASEPHNQELLLLFGRHPHAHLSRLAIRHALGWRKSHVERELAYLVEKGLVNRRTQNGTCFYWLTEIASVNQLVQSLARLDPAQRKLLLEQDGAPDANTAASPEATAPEKPLPLFKPLPRPVAHTDEKRMEAGNS